jgi:tetratricopeptide (TPR) repeat protein
VTVLGRWAHLGAIAALVGGAAPAMAQRDSGASARVHALLDRGRLDDAERAGRSGGMATEVALGDVLVARGALATADSLYADAVARRAPDALSALAGRAELALRRGDVDGALAWAHAVTDGYRADAGWTPNDMVAAGRSYVVLGTVDPAAFHDALAAFDDAAAADSNDLDAQLRGADLLVGKYNGPDARDTYRGVLTRSPDNAWALLGLARVAALDGQTDPAAAVDAALQRDPVLVPALVFLARLELGRAAYDSATAAAGRALAVDSTATQAWGVLGAVAWLRGDSAGFRWARAGALRSGPNTSEFLLEVAEAAAAQRRYAEAVTLARQAADADTLNSRAIGVLGSNELRTGAMAVGRADLERAFALDPYNFWYLNTLNLLDSMQTYRTVRTDHFELVAPPADAAYLQLYLGPLLEKAWARYRERYDWEPTTPVRVELFNRHADFSVRTLGLTGLDDVLGVSFGTVIALDAPPARPSGEYNYGSTAWHELAHTFTLGLSAHRVPRWLSEGLSVLEEQEVGDGWGDAVSLAFLAAYKGGKLPPATDLNSGLNQPAYPAEISFSYYEASLVCRMIESEQGIGAIRAMLRGYARGLDTPGVLQAVFGMTPRAFDDHFDAWLRKRFAAGLAAVDGSDGVKPPGGAYPRLIADARQQLDADPDSARGLLQRAERLFPGYGGSDGAAWLLSQLDQRQGQASAAVRQLATVTLSQETAAGPNDAEATLRLRLGDTTGALLALGRLQWITPYDIGLHQQTADLDEALQRYQAAVLERRAVLALAPPDRLDARYQLARDLFRAGQVDAARTEVLSVLEDAPNYVKAQELLLQIHGSNP